MQDAMQRTAPAAASMPEALAYTWKQPNTSLQLTACEAGCDKPKDATGHKPCTPSVLAEDDNGLSTSSQDPDTLVGQDDSADEAGAEAKKPAKAGMAMVRAAGCRVHAGWPTKLSSDYADSSTFCQWRAVAMAGAATVVCDGTGSRVYACVSDALWAACTRRPAARRKQGCPCTVFPAPGHANAARVSAPWHAV